MNEPLPSLAPLLHRSLIGAIALCLFGGAAFGQSTPTGFSLIPGGSFTMGVTSGDTDFNLPSITVTVSPFYIQQTETTKVLWDEVRTWGLSNGYTDLEAGAGKAPNHPVQGVTWWNVVKWCNARSEKEGLSPCYYTGEERRADQIYRSGYADNLTVCWGANGYRLPTDAEWEKAARGGVSGKRFPWGTDTISHAQANYDGDSEYAYDQSTIKDYHPSYTAGEWPYTSPVGSFGVNGYGLYDMSGNVWEWCWDWYENWYGSDYYTTINGTTDPRGPSFGNYRVRRGGSWCDDAFYASCASRESGSPGRTSGEHYGGFRPVRSSVP
jgi:formylglycine-generating enzyme required for sulfatase activity